MNTSDENIQALERAAKTGGQLDAITVLQVLAERKIDKAWIVELTEQKAKWVAWANEASAEADEVKSMREQVRLLTEQRDAVVVEFAKFKTAHPQPFGPEMMKALDAYEKYQDEVPETGMLNAFFILRDSIVVETPAISSAIAERRAEGEAPLIKALLTIANSEEIDGDTVVCDFDSLVSVAAGALSQYYARQLRESKGAQS